MKKGSRKRRRAVSTIVGGFFFLILMVGTFTAVFTSLQLQSDLVDTQRVISEQDTGKFREKFKVVSSVINAASGDNHALTVDVINQGTAPVEITDIFIVNKTASGQPVFQISVLGDDGFVPTSSNVSITKSQSITMNTGRYEVKAVSRLGNIEVDELTVPFNPLSVTTFLVPPAIPTNTNATLVIHAFNRGNSTLLDVKPNGEPTVIPRLAVSAVTQLDPLRVNALEPQEGAVFVFSYKLTGGVGTVVEFSANVTGTDSVTGASTSSTNDTAKVTFIQSAKRIFQEPDIFVIVPSPFGSTANDKGLWGVVIANPTDVPIKVSRINIQLLAADDSDELIINSVPKCEITPIFPTTASEWTCPIKNVIQWQDLTTPETVGARDVVAFMALYETGSIGGPDDETAVTIAASVVTSFGVFGKTGFVTGMRKAGDAIGNVYLTTDRSPLSDALISTNIRGSLRNIPSGSAVNFNVTLADFETGTAHIKGPTKVSVIVPPGFVVNTSTIATTSPFSTFNPSTDITTFADGSTEIVANLPSLSTIGASGQQAAVLKFYATAPTVSDEALYAMFILVNGQSGNNFSTVPFAEIALQVLPPP